MLEIDCAKYRKESNSMASSHTTETAVPREDENAPLLNKQSTLANDRVVTKSSTNTDNKGYKRDQTKAAKVERRARRLFNAAGNNLSMEESRKQAFKEVTEARRIYAQRQRISMKEKGIKKNKSRKQGYGNKNESIARKIVALLKIGRAHV